MIIEVPIDAIITVWLICTYIDRKKIYAHMQNIKLMWENLE